jgi:hypothetical protein
MSQAENKVVKIKAPMTARQFRDEKRALEAKIGPYTYIGIDVGSITQGKDDPPIRFSVYPRGICIGSPLYAYAEDWDEGVIRIRELWDREREKTRVRTIRDMALAIIKFTDETGSCSEAQLRQDGFSDGAVREYGDEACGRAAQMGGRAPFAIIKTAKSNAA